MPVSRRVVGGDERAPRVAGPQQHGLSAATSESSVSATTRHGLMGELVRIAATMALRTHASDQLAFSRRSDRTRAVVANRSWVKNN